MIIKIWTFSDTWFLISLVFDRTAVWVPVLWLERVWDIQPPDMWSGCRVGPSGEPWQCSGSPCWPLSWGPEACSCLSRPPRLWSTAESAPAAVVQGSTCVVPVTESLVQSLGHAFPCCPVPTHQRRAVCSYGGDRVRGCFPLPKRMFSCTLSSYDQGIKDMTKAGQSTNYGNGLDFKYTGQELVGRLLPALVWGQGYWFKKKSQREWNQ